MRFAPIFVLLLIFPGAAAPAQTSPQREKWLKHLRLMIAEEPKADILVENESDQIGAALKKGDPELAKAVIQASNRMLDNEGMTRLVIEAIVYNPEPAVAAIQGLGARERSELLPVLTGMADNCSPAEYRKMTTALKRVPVEAKKQPERSSNEGRLAVIDDPDGFTNVRAEPDKTARVVATVKTGVVFTVLNERGDWCYVETRFGEKGYMHQSRVRYLK